MGLVGVRSDVARPGTRRDGHERLFSRTEIERRPLTIVQDVAPENVEVKAAAIGISLEDDLKLSRRVVGVRCRTQRRVESVCLSKRWRVWAKSIRAALPPKRRSP